MSIFNYELKKDVNLKFSSWPIVSFFFFILGLLLLLISNFIGPHDWEFHVIFFTLSTFVIIIKFLELRKLNLKILIFDPRWLLSFSFWIYFIFGSSLLFFGSEEVREILTQNVNANEILKVNALNSIGFSLIIIILTYLKLTWPKEIILSLANEVKKFDDKGDKCIIFLLVLTTYSLLSFSFVSFGFINPGIFFGLQGYFKEFTLGFIIISFFYRGKLSLKIKLFTVLLNILYSIIGILLTNKTQALMPLLLFFICHLIKKNSFKFILVKLFIILFLIFVLVNLADRLRASNLRTNPINERISFLSSYTPKIFTKDHQSYQIWDRLNYAPVQSAALKFYDQNNGGLAYKTFVWLLLPRFLFKDKPSMSNEGVILADKFLDHSGSSLSSGIFIEGYYNLGWIGFLLWSISAGLIIKIYQTLISTILLKNIYYLMCLLIFGLNTSFRVDGHIATDYFGSMIITLYLIIFLLFFLKFMRLIIFIYKNKTLYLKKL